jgi:hypothetical protein
VAVNRTVPRVTPPAGTLSFSAAPSAAEIFAARVFAEPLVLVGGEASAAENIAVASALLQFHDAGDPGATASVHQLTLCGGGASRSRNWHCASARCSRSRWA